MVKFNTSKKESYLIELICRRGWPLIVAAEVPMQLLDLEMVISTVHKNGTPLDLERLLVAQENSFRHDIFGIIGHFEMATGTLKNHFLPHAYKGD
jgi:hypothetical protein